MDTVEISSGNTSGFEDNRYSLTRMVIDNSVKPGVARYEMCVMPDLRFVPYTEHIVKENEVGRLDLLAKKYYKNPKLWVVIARNNGIRNVFEDMSAGQVLEIPSLESIRRVG